MKKELQGFEEGNKGSKGKPRFSLSNTQKCQIGKVQAMMPYMDSSLKNSLPSAT